MRATGPKQGVLNYPPPAPAVNAAFLTPVRFCATGFEKEKEQLGAREELQTGRFETEWDCGRTHEELTGVARGLLW